METLDLTYLNEIVQKAQRGSSNAFAELYSATWPAQYAYAVRSVGFFLAGGKRKGGSAKRDPADRETAALARSALKSAYSEALKGMAKLQQPALFLPWLSQMLFADCARAAGHEGLENRRVRVDRRVKTIGQILMLPVIEGQVLIMLDYQGLNAREAGEVLNLGTGAVKRYRRMAVRHLEMLEF